MLPKKINLTEREAESSDIGTEQKPKSLIQQYLLAKGFDPRFASKEKIMALGKSDDFRKWREENYSNQAESVKPRSLQDVKAKFKKDQINDPWVGVDPKANITRVAEGTDLKKEYSKSARIIKAIYKKHKMTEGKNPILKMNKKEADPMKNGDSPAAILVGGKTLTGQDRDMIEIDPVMKKDALTKKK